MASGVRAAYSSVAASGLWHQMLCPFLFSLNREFKASVDTGNSSAPVLCNLGPSHNSSTSLSLPKDNSRRFQNSTSEQWCIEAIWSLLDVHQDVDH